MISTGMAVGQQGDYLEQAQSRVKGATSLGSDVEDYYVQGTEAPGYWLGRGSERLGMVGEVDRDALACALEGRDPASDRELVASRMRRVPDST